VIAETYGGSRAALFALDSEGKLYASGELSTVGIGNPQYGADVMEEHLVMVRVPVL